MAIIKTPSGATFNTDRPVKSSLLKIWDEKGRSKLDTTAKLTGRFTEIEEFGEKKYMLEVNHFYNIDEINEDFIWQD